MCGLAAYVGDNYQETLFKLVALAQDERGRDNAGFGYVLKDEFQAVLGGTEPKRVFKALVDNDVNGYPAYPAKSLAELLGDHHGLPFRLNSYIMAHSRKATVGCGGPANAQPFITDDIMFMHNGTISNHQHFKNTYKLPEYTSDSQVAAYMIAQGKADTFFEQYKGTVTCIWGHRDEPHCYYVFSGSDHYYGATPPAPNKPLYYLEVNGGVYSSTQPKVLNILAELINDPYTPLPQVQQYQSNFVYRVSEEGVEILYQINRSLKSKPRESTPPPKTRHAVDILDKDRAALLPDEPDLLQYAAGKYYLNGDPVHTKYTVNKEEEVTYYPLYVSKNSYLCYKKLENGQFVTAITKQSCQEREGNIIPVPFLEGILISSWENFFRLARNFGSLTTKDLAEASPLPVNVRVFHRDYPSEWFLTRGGKVINYSIVPPFVQKKYYFTSNKIEKIEAASLEITRTVTNRYVGQLEKRSPKIVAPKKTGKSKLSVVIGVLMRYSANPKYTNKERLTAFRAAEFINEKLGLNDTRVKKPEGLSLWSRDPLLPPLHRVDYTSASLDYKVVR